MSHYRPLTPQPLQPPLPVAITAAPLPPTAPINPSRSCPIIGSILSQIVYFTNPVKSVNLMPQCMGLHHASVDNFAKKREAPTAETQSAKLIS